MSTERIFCVKGEIAEIYVGIAGDKSEWAKVETLNFSILIFTCFTIPFLSLLLLTTKLK